jgi:hypothetical protein
LSLSSVYRQTPTGVARPSGVAIKLQRLKPASSMVFCAKPYLRKLNLVAMSGCN